MTNAFAPDPSAAVLSPPGSRGPGDRAGVWIAWGVIFVCVSFTLYVSWKATRARTGLTDGPFEHDPLEAVEQSEPPRGAGGRRAAQAMRDPANFPSAPLKVAARQAIGLRGVFGDGAASPAGPATRPASSTRPAGAADQSLQQVRRAAAASPLDALRAVPVIAEVQGRDAALAELDRLKVAPGHPLARDAQSLRTIYARGPQSLDPDARADLLRRHGWFAQLALSSGKPPDDPDRREALAPARRAAAAVMSVFGAVCLAGIAGVVLLVVAIIRFVGGKLRLAYSGYGRPAAAPQPYWHPYYYSPPPPAYPPAYGAYPYLHPSPYPPQPFPNVYPQSYVLQPPPAPQAGAPAPGAELAETPDRLASPRTGPFLEAFAIYLASQILLSVAIHFAFPNKATLEMEWLMLALLPVIFLWPVWRGVTWRDLRRALGWHLGRGVFREIGAGVVGYVAGFPVFFLCAMVSAVLTYLSGSDPAHPIQFEVGKSFTGNLQLYLLACVWAPVVEETMFRGALFHHLRRRWNWLISAAFSGLIFAAVHPQGWTAIPVLGSLGLIFAAIREWRGSAIASMAGHFIQNFTVTTMLILAAA
jgi:membrane protease YdiL (CAAX protease family)